MNIRTLSRSGLVSHVRTPLYRNAYAWMFSTGISSGLGIVYWVLAARHYPVEAVGLNAAIISAMIFVSGVSQLNLVSALVRFIPVAGQATGRLVGYAYLLSSTLAALLGLLVIWGVSGWSAGADWGIGSSFGVWFVLATMVWSIFSLQDSVLTGLRDAVWVPVENIAYAVFKIGLLIPLARLSPQYGILASWMIPVLFVILPVNLLIFRRLIPRQLQETKETSAPLVPAQIVRYVAGNYVGSLFTLASARLLPILVTQRAGAAAGAYFYLSWTIANTLKLMATQMTLSLTVEGALEQTNLGKHSARFLVSMTAVLAPAVVVMVAGAPFLLRLSGNDYASAATGVLRLLALAVIPSIVTLLYIGMARAQNRIHGIVVVQGILSSMVLLLSYVFLPAWGITGVGIAMLASEILVAGGLSLTQLRSTLWPEATLGCIPGFRR